MSDLLVTLEQINSWKDELKKVARRNKVPIGIASYYSPSKIQSFLNFVQKRNQVNGQKKRKFWLQNQLRALHWILLAVSLIHQLNVKQFGNEQWMIIKDFFHSKPIQMLQYQAIKLVGQKKKITSNWTEPQNTLLAQIILEKNPNQEKTNKWNDIARQLYQKSKGQFFRTGKQCRQRWLNHLDPSKKHGDWSQEEDYVIARVILCSGKKWSEIARLLERRTQHMVKNRYKSIMIKYKKSEGKNFSQTSKFQNIIENYKGEGIQIQTLGFSTVKTRLQVTKNNNLQENSQKPQYIDSKTVHICRVNSIKIIKQQGQYQNQEMNDDLSFLQSLSQVDYMQKQLPQEKITYDSMRGSLDEIRQMNSPSVWNHTARTPGYYGFSPCNPLFSSFDQYERQFNQKYKNKSFN